MRRRTLRRKKVPSGTPTNKEGVQEQVVVRKPKEKLNGAHYSAGPALALSNILDQGVKRPDAENSMLAEHAIAPPQVRGQGNPTQKSAMGTSVSLQGRTDADFDGGSFSTQNVRVSAASGCESCGDGDQCIRARGVLVARYHVTTTVTLPSVNDFPDLTPCQQARVQNAIDTVLAPHEQEHVDAFNQYNGVTRTSFDVTVCRSAFDSHIQGMFDAQESARRASAQADSDALDPFNFSVDIDCEEPSEGRTERNSTRQPESDKPPVIRPPTEDKGTTHLQAQALHARQREQL